MTLLSKECTRNGSAIFQRWKNENHRERGKRRHYLFNSGGSPMKRTFIVIIFTFCKTFFVRTSKSRKAINSTVWLRNRFQFKKFIQTRIPFFFRHRSVRMNSIPFCVMPFKELLFFKTVISLFQFHCANNIGQNF